MLWIAVASLGAAMANGVGQLTGCRFLAGLALGGYPPIVIAYLTDLLPPQRRGTLIFLSLTPSLLGPPAAIFMVRWLAAAAAARAGGLALGVPRGQCLCVAVGPVLPRAAGVAPLAARTRPGGAGRGRCCRRSSAPPPCWRRRPIPWPHRRPFTRRPAPTRPAPIPAHRRWLAVVGLFSLSPWATIAFPLLTGAVLAQRGFKLDAALLIFGLSSMGPLVGTLLASTVMDRIERRVAMAACIVGDAGLRRGVQFQHRDGGADRGDGLVQPLGVALRAAADGLQRRAVPDPSARVGHIRSPGRSTASGGALGPLLLVPTLRGAGPAVMFAVVAASLVATLAVLAASPRGRERQAIS